VTVGARVSQFVYRRRRRTTPKSPSSGCGGRQNLRKITGRTS
jgi:hypothetical protein